MRKNKISLANELTADINHSINDLVKILLDNKADIVDLKEEIENIKFFLNQEKNRLS